MVGLFGEYCSDKNFNCIHDIKDGLFYQNHRGEKFCGAAIKREDETILKQYKGLIRETITSDKLEKLKGNHGIGCVSVRDQQPIMTDSKIGEFYLAFDGRIPNVNELREEFKQSGHSFITKGEVEVLGKLIGEGDDLQDGIEKMTKKIKGSYSLVILNDDGVYAARDPYGFKPMVLGENKGRYAVASESCAFHVTNMKIKRDVEPGEIVQIGEDGFKTVKKLESKRRALCSFEIAYNADRDSIIDGISVSEGRKNIGAALAKDDNIDADIVSAVQFSGMGHALGYHQESNIPYDDVFLLKRYTERSYYKETQTGREKMADLKLSLLLSSVLGKKIILVDDSIVRGTQMRKLVKLLKDAGAEEVHVRSASPRIEAPCYYGQSTRTYGELAAKKYTIEELTKKLGADTLKHNSVEDFAKAVVKGSSLTECDLCLTCFTDELVY